MNQVPEQRTPVGRPSSWLIDADERAYYRLQWKLLREANEKAAAALRKFNRLNADFNLLAEKMGWNENIKVLRDRRSENYSLRNAADEYGDWHKEAMRISSLIQAELAMRQLLSGPTMMGSDVQ